MVPRWVFQQPANTPFGIGMKRGVSQVFAARAQKRQTGARLAQASPETKHRFYQEASQDGCPTQPRPNRPVRPSPSAIRHSALTSPPAPAYEVPSQPSCQRFSQHPRSTAFLYDSIELVRRTNAIHETAQKGVRWFPCQRVPTMTERHVLLYGER